MITYSNLGHMGRLGNQMFQIASTIGIAKTFGHMYGFPSWEHQACFKKPLPSYVLEGNPTNVASYIKPTILHIYEQGYKFSTNEIKHIHADVNYDLVGYYQSPKYWEGHEEEVKSYFKLNEETFNKVFNNYVSLAQKFPPRMKLELVGIHVRRGDYPANYLHHTDLANTKYYQIALTKLRTMIGQQQLNVVIFSDDVAFCKEYFNQSFLGIDFVYADTQDPVIDMFTMSLMDHHVIANSSFSWWAAYLSRNSDGYKISPGDMIPWFGPKYDQDKYNTEDLIPKGWYQI